MNNYELNQMVDQQLNDYLNSDNPDLDWNGFENLYSGLENEGENMTDQDWADLAIESLRNRYCNEYADLLEMEHEGIELTEKQERKRDRLFMYFLKFSTDQMNEWIKFPVDR